MHIHDTSTASIAATLPTEALRTEFLLSNLFEVGAANFHYWTTDRTIVGAIVPGATALELPNPPEVRSTFFLERREAGVKQKKRSWFRAPDKDHRVMRGSGQPRRL